MNEIQVSLSQGLVALIDDADAPAVLGAGNWYACRGYAMRNMRRPDGTRTTQQLHTFLTGWPLVDHVNGDGLDNRRANLREATPLQNNRNRGIQSTNTSGFKGVSWDRNRRCWQAKIGIQGRTLALGRHDTPEGAARAYDEAAREHFKEFARLNFPLDGESAVR